jgi:hypothetical protein
VIDDGLRCDDHVGEVFPPRCEKCDAERRDPTKSETAELQPDRF